jgi:hypothetical protein
MYWPLPLPARSNNALTIATDAACGHQVGNRLRRISAHRHRFIVARRYPISPPIA